jgi:tetratricopeptide (TPR) repeat protein
MSSRYTKPVIGSLSLLWFACALPTALAAQTDEKPLTPSIVAPLPETNSISNLEVKQGAGGVWLVEFDYSYTGKPVAVTLRVEAVKNRSGAHGAPTPRGHMNAFMSVAQRGTHHVSFVLPHPGQEQITHKVIASLRGMPPAYDSIATQEIAKVIEWPTFATWSRNQQMAKMSTQQVLDQAVKLIDTGGGSSLQEAKNLLEALIGENPALDPAYVELARIAMKTNWGPEGLHHAETLLDSALRIKPDSVNAKILLGYVYTHQRRFPEAERLFVEASKSNPRNLWLWVNWADMLAMQGKDEQATLKYREAVTRPMTHDTYDRARDAAYQRLLTLNEQKKDYDGMEALHKQRLADFGPGSCYSADYARFLLQQRGDVDGAIGLARKGLDQNCEDAESREILGLASYLKWSATKGPERVAALNQARIYLPAGPNALYLLATSERTLPAAKELIAAGEQIDQLDNKKYTALAKALNEENLDAARRLMKLGARADISVGYEEIPVALLPVLEGNLKAIRMLRQSGVDYSTLRYRGVTAIEFAQQLGDPELLEALGKTSVSL